MNVRDENIKCVNEMLAQLDTLLDSFNSIAGEIRVKIEEIRRGMEVEAQLSRKTHPPDPLELELEDPRDDD